MRSVGWGWGVACSAIMLASVGCELLSGVDDLEVGGAGGGPSGVGGRAVGGQGGAGGVVAAGGSSGGGGCLDGVDFDSDPEHCGRCERSCRGGACISGQCQPVVLVAVAPGITSLAVTSTQLAWNSYLHDQVYWADKAGAVPLSFHARPASTPRSVALDANKLVWTNELDVAPELVTASLDPAAAASPIDTAAQIGQGVALDPAGDIYWITRGAVADGGGVFRCTSSCGASPADQPIGSEGLSWPFAIAVDATHAYWTTLVDGAVQRIDKASIGASVAFEAVSTSPGDPGVAIATDDGALVYWAGYGSATVWSVDKGALFPAAPNALATGYPLPSALALDSGYVYLTYQGPSDMACEPGMAIGGVVRIPRAGGPVEELASEQLCPHAVAVDDEFVYWGSYSSGVIQRLVK